VDMAGDLSGITGMEFPLLNALHTGCGLKSRRLDRY
jgi:hypothetical protein